jgi:hypothetical protein
VKKTFQAGDHAEIAAKKSNDTILLLPALSYNLLLALKEDLVPGF